MALTNLGFKRRLYDDILTSNISRAKQLFGEDIDTSELTPLGKFIRILTYDAALVEEEAELIYYSIFPNTATGTSLDRLCVFVGVSRNPATSALYAVNVTGNAGATIPAGFLVGTEAGVNYSNINDAVLDENGNTVIFVECVERGEIGNVPAASINTIVNPVTEIESINGLDLMEKGQETESDYELRKRFNEANQGLGSCNEVAVKAAILRVPTVTHAIVIADEEVGSFECFVNGGENYHAEIAKAIFDKKPIGVKTTGKVAQKITDDNDITHTINFSHTANVNVYVRAAISTTAEFEDAGKAAIKDNIETQIDSLGIGKSVVLSTLYGKIYSVVGVSEVTEILLSTDGQSWSTDNINIGVYENAVCCQVELNLNNGGYGVV